MHQILIWLAHFCFSFQSLRLFRLAAELEGKAAALRKEGLQHLTIALAGSDTRELFTLLVTFFGRGTEVDPFSFIDATPLIKRPLDLTDTESESDTDAASTSTAASALTEPTASTSTSPATPAPAKKRIRIRQKVSYPDKCSDVQEAIGFLPEEAGSLHNTGVPSLFQVRRVGKNDRGTSLYSCPHPECSDPPYTGDISGCGSHVRRVHLGHCVSCPYCPDKKYYNADGWRRHMKEKHSKVPWYSSEIRGPSAPATETEPVPIPPVAPVIVLEDEPPLEDTLPYAEAPSPDDDDAPVEATPTRPPTLSTETTEQLPSDTKDHDYSVHGTHRPAAPVIASRYRQLDTPDESQDVTEAIVASAAPDCPNPDPPEGPPQRKRRKVEFSVQTEPTRSFKGPPYPKEDPDDDAPTSMV